MFLEKLFTIETVLKS